VTHVPLPERLFSHLRLLEATYPYRYGLLLALASGILFAIVLDRMHTSSRRLATLSGRAATIPVVVCVLAPLIPARAYPMTTIPIPRYFRSSPPIGVRTGAVLLTYPAPTPQTSTPMIWQATARLSFRMIGGYMFARNSRRQFTLTPSDNITEETLFDLWAREPRPWPPPAWPPQALRRSILRELRSWQVSAVVVDTSARGARRALGLFSTILRAAPQYGGGVALVRRGSKE
jgi:hypothetical protein